MKISLPRKCLHNKHVVDVCYDSDDFYFTSQHFNNESDAINWSKNWGHWANNVADGTVDSIYYILQVPDTWPGPLGSNNPYHGLFVKIGRSNNVLKRLANLQTGTFGQLIIHALEPGGSSREKELHQLFSSERRQGEWFSCTPKIVQHIFQTWFLNKMLPPEHQKKIIELKYRIRDYSAAREIMGKPFDTINPSLHDEWHGTVFVDLIYSSLAKSCK